MQRVVGAARCHTDTMSGMCALGLGWFIPDGATKRLGEMEFEEALGFDFRAKALTKLIARLEEMNAALNLGSSF